MITENDSVEGGKINFKKIGRTIRKGAKKIDKGINKAIYKAGDDIKKAVNQKVNLASKVIFNNAGLAPYVSNFICDPSV